MVHFILFYINRRLISSIHTIASSIPLPGQHRRDHGLPTEIAHAHGLALKQLWNRDLLRAAGRADEPAAVATVVAATRERKIGAALHAAFQSIVGHPVWLLRDMRKKSMSALVDILRVANIQHESAPARVVGDRNGGTAPAIILSGVVFWLE